MADLLYAGADVSARNESGFTALMQAGAGSPENVKVLLDAGAEISARAEQGMTALMVAATHGSPETVAALLDAGADGSLGDEDGHTAFDYAKKINSALKGTDVYWRLNEARYK